MLWQRFGRAGRDPTLKALAIAFVFEKHLLPLEIAQNKTIRHTKKPTRTQRTAVRQALDSCAFENYGYLHRRLFPPGIRDKLSDVCTWATDGEAISRELDNTRFHLHESSLYIN